METNATTTKSFIETQFPVSKLSKESYKERKAVSGQTLTGLGKWWGRKPLVLVRACILGLLMPASDNPKRDREVFLKLMTMDEDGLWRRYVAKGMTLKQTDVYRLLNPADRDRFFVLVTDSKSEAQWKKGLSKDEKAEAHRLAFTKLNYDDKLDYCLRPEEISGPSEAAWVDINVHLETSATTLQELVAELGQRRFGRVPRVGDAFCGGGSIPFEAARLGCEAYGSDLNPVAALLTWAAIHIVGGGEEVAARVRKTLDDVYAEVKQQVDEWGIERHELGWVADAYIYCHEVLDPESGWRVPLAPSWLIAPVPRVVAVLQPNHETKSFSIEIVQGASDDILENAEPRKTKGANGKNISEPREETWADGVKSPYDRHGQYVPPSRRIRTSSEELRGPRGLRRWENDDLVPRPDDVFQERLYCIKWRIPTLERLLCAEQLLKVGEAAPGLVLSLGQVQGTLDIMLPLLTQDDQRFVAVARSLFWRAAASGILAAYAGVGDIDADEDGAVEATRELKRDLAIARKLLPSDLVDLPKVTKRAPRYLYRAPDKGDMKREELVLSLLRERFVEWQKQGFLPSMRIEPGYNTDQPIRERGYDYWHHLFNPRQLLFLGTINSKGVGLGKAVEAGLRLMLGRFADNCSRLCVWHKNLNGVGGIANVFLNQALNCPVQYGHRASPGFDNIADRFPAVEGAQLTVECLDARDTEFNADIWITDPPYADAVNYEELADFFLAWYAPFLKREFPSWPPDSRKALAVKGKGHSFMQAMVDAYSRMSQQMPDEGRQLVMFTHTDSEVWGQLSLVLWASGLKVESAWTIATETDAGGFKSGNYVQGTVNLVLRKRLGDRTAWRSDILPEIQDEVERQLDSMMSLDDQEDPNFTDSDLQLAAYAAALRVLTQYARIEDLDVGKELARLRPQPNVVRERKKERNPIVDLIDEAVKIASDYLVPAGLDRQLWRSLQPLERLYVKGLEVERHGDYRNGVYMEFARGFGVRDYKVILADTKANQTRLKTATEFGSRDLRGGDFGDTLLRQALCAVYKTAQEDDPTPGRNWLRQEVPQYWNLRQNIIGLLHYLAHTPTAAMEHWSKDAAAAELLRGMVENDSV